MSGEYNDHQSSGNSPVRIADSIELRLKRHPAVIRLIMLLFDGLPLCSSRADLEKFCQEQAIVILRPERSVPEWK